MSQQHATTDCQPTEANNNREYQSGFLARFGSGTLRLRQQMRPLT